MRLWVLRHGEAERHTQRDSERNLTARGELDARAAGDYLAANTTQKLRILASPYNRAQQTAQSVVIALPGKAISTVDWLTPDDDPKAALAELAKLRDSEILLVSHQPLVSALGGLLISGDYRAGPTMGTASLAEFDLSTVAMGCGKLLSLRHAPDYRRSVL